MPWFVLSGVILAVLWGGIAYAAVAGIAANVPYGARYAAGCALLTGCFAAFFVLKTSRAVSIDIADRHAGRPVSCAATVVPARGVAHGSIDVIQREPGNGLVSAQSTIDRDDVLVLHGWASDAALHGVLAGVCLTIDGNVTVRQKDVYGVTRPDVAAVFHDAGVADSGFEIRADARELLPGRHLLNVIGFDARGRGEAIAVPLPIVVK